MKLKIKRINKDAKIPHYAHHDDAGMDVYALTKEVKDKFIEYGTGLSFEVPEGYMMLVFPRGSLSNKDLIMANHVGVLDAGYRGELKMRFRKTGDDVYEIGDKIGQIIVVPFPKVEFEEVEELSETNRGGGGFGSTGK